MFIALGGQCRHMFLAAANRVHYEDGRCAREGTGLQSHENRTPRCFPQASLKAPIRGIMSWFCPNCQSDQLKKLELVHAEGTLAHRGLSKEVNVRLPLFGSRTRIGLGVAKHAVEQTALATQHAP